MSIGSAWKAYRSERSTRKADAVPEPARMYETVILGGGPAGTGSLVWAARHGHLGDWLDRGIALVEKTGLLGGSLGRYPLNADSRGTSFLECVDGQPLQPLLAEVRADAVTQELEGFRGSQPTLELVDRFERRLGAALLKEFAQHPNSRAYTNTTVLAIHRQPDDTVAVVVATEEGRRQVIRAASAVVALGGKPFASWDDVELAPGVPLGRWHSRIISSNRVLTQGGGEEIARRLGHRSGSPRVVIIGGAHSAFSAAWILLDRIPGIGFGPGGVQILHRTDPRPTYTSREAAHEDSYEFTEEDVCQATGRVHRLGGLQGDGREVWRRIHGKPGALRDDRAVTIPIDGRDPSELIALLDDADLIIPALGYRLAAPPIFDAEGRPVGLASTGPAVGPDSRLLATDGTAIPGLFGVGLGSGFTPWGQMSGEVSFSGQQNSLWLYQNGLGEMIYSSTHRLAEAARARTAAAAQTVVSGA
jgi:hypothetical protein